MLGTGKCESCKQCTHIVPLPTTPPLPLLLDPRSNVDTLSPPLPLLRGDRTAGDGCPLLAVLTEPLPVVDVLADVATGTPSSERDDEL